MHDTEPVQFASWDGRFALTLSESAAEAMIVSSDKAKGKETGGILIGQYRGPALLAIVREATTKPRDSLFGRFWFQRGAHGLKKLLADRWKEGLHYIGEWHCHPGGRATPSDPDIRAMRAIAENPAYDCSSPLLVILGGNPPLRIEFSATVFPANEPHLVLKQAPSS